MPNPTFWAVSIFARDSVEDPVITRCIAPSPETAMLLVNRMWREKGGEKPRWIHIHNTREEAESTHDREAEARLFDLMR